MPCQQLVCGVCKADIHSLLQNESVLKLKDWLFHLPITLCFYSLIHNSTCAGTGRLAACAGSNASLLPPDLTMGQAPASLMGLLRYVPVVQHAQVQAHHSGPNRGRVAQGQGFGWDD